VTISIPPLRERTEDIPLLIMHFLARTSSESGLRIPEISDEAIERLLRYPWPGNIRELQNAIQKALIRCHDGRIKISDLPPKVAGEYRPSVNLEFAVARGMTLEELEQEYIHAIMASVGGNKTEAATLLGIDRKTLYRKLGAPEAE
jgi:DNA-binding NtrC family response regulator